MKLMIITVGTGRNREDIAQAILYSIRQNNPDYIKFLVTEKSQEETMPLILDRVHPLNIEYSVYSSKKENDVVELLEEYNNEISAILKSSKNHVDVIVDYTSGTKPMSVAVVLSAIKHSINELSYISGKRGEDGRVITGTERLQILRLNEFYAKSLLEEGIEFFNNEHFASALEKLEKVKKINYQDREFIDKLKVITGLFEAYYKWDIFDLDGCFNLLKELEEEQLAAIGVQSEVEANKIFLYKERTDSFCVERVVDLYLNAKRRAKEKKYDDAVARLYRLCEFLFQREVAKLGFYIDNDTDRLDTCKLPPALRVEYEPKVKNGRLPLGLEGTIDLLKKIGDDSIKKVENEIFNLRNITSLRNKSILAHGFGHINEKGYTRYLDFVESIANKLIPNFKESCEEFKFPEIKITL
jgi:CRISPR-associated protein (TIGR02710 family)